MTKGTGVAPSQGVAQAKSSKTLHERRGAAEAELRALDARAAEQRAAAEAEEAEREANQRQARARHAELTAQLEGLDRYLADQTARAYQEWSREHEKRQDMMRQLRAVADAEPPHVRRSMEEHQADLARLDRYVDAAQQAEEDRLYRECDAWESRRLIDPAYRRRMAITHPGGADNCPCAHHQAWRKHWPRR